MKPLRSLVVCTLLFAPLLMSQKISLLLSETSGFLGLGKPKFVTIALSTRQMDQTLTSENVNADASIYFLLQDGNGWVADEDFIREELVKFRITQDGMTWNIAAVDTLIKTPDHFSLLVTAKKNLLALHKPFKFIFPMKERLDSAAMEVPKECWPGYAKFTKLTQTAGAALAAGNSPGAVTTYDEVFSDYSLKVFADFDTIVVNRTGILQKMLTEQIQQFQQMCASKASDTKQKIASTESFLTSVTFIADNAGKWPTVNQNGVQGENEVVVRASAYVARSKHVRDSLTQALDDQTIRFIVQGSSGGRVDFKYRYAVEAIAAAYASINFDDTTAAALNVVLPEMYEARLQKYALVNAYETFRRIVTSRWLAKKPMFPIGFLQNLEKDSSQFSLPVNGILRTVQAYYQKDYPAAKVQIEQVLKSCYLDDLTERIDHIRVLITTAEKRVPAEVQQKMTEGARAEERGEVEKAIEQYKDALLVAEDYAPAAFALGKIFEKKEDVYTANNYYQKAVAIDSQYFSAYRCLVNNYNKSGNFKPMIDLLNQALAAGNDYFYFHFYLGIAYNGTAQYDLAIEQYESALELNRKNVSANIQAGISYQNLKSYPQAREYYNRAVAIEPENLTATENLKHLDELQKN